MFASTQGSNPVNGGASQFKALKRSGEQVFLDNVGVPLRTIRGIKDLWVYFFHTARLLFFPWGGG